MMCTGIAIRRLSLLLLIVIGESLEIDQSPRISADKYSV